MHVHFLGEMAALAVVTERAGRDHVVPGIIAAARHRNDVVAGQELTPTKLCAVTAAILTAVAITSKQERVGDLTAELARHVNEANEPDDQRACHVTALGMEYTVLIDFENFGFLVDDQPQRTSDWQDRQRFERSVESQTSHGRKAILPGGRTDFRKAGSAENVLGTIIL